MLEEELALLAEWDLIRLERVDRLPVFGITPDGREVAEGVVSRDGIAQSATGSSYD